MYQGRFRWAGWPHRISCPVRKGLESKIRVVSPANDVVKTGKLPGGMGFVFYGDPGGIGEQVIQQMKGFKTEYSGKNGWG